MKKTLAALAVSLMGLGAGVASADTCGGTYVVRPGDSLSAISDRLYKNAGYWTTIHNNNINTIGPRANALRVGMKLNLTCIDGLPVGLQGGTAVSNVVQTSAPAPTASVLPKPSVQRGKIFLLTGDDFAPFTDRKLDNGGLLAEVVTSAMKASVGEQGFETFWVNDWSSHLTALMPAGVMEMAYPWARPDCEADPSNQRCVDFHFSKPVFEYLVLMYVDKSRPVPFATDSDIHGRTICRPAGYLTHMLDKDGRNWVSGNKITLARPDKVSECFEMLAEGEVDGVILNEFTARDAIFSLGLQDQIEPVLERPVSITGLHVLIHKTHPEAEAMLNTVDRGLDAIKADGQYQEIVNRHMAAIWAGYATN